MNKMNVLNSTIWSYNKKISCYTKLLKNINVNRDVISVIISFIIWPYTQRNEQIALMMRQRWCVSYVHNFHIEASTGNQILYISYVYDSITYYMLVNRELWLHSIRYSHYTLDKTSIENISALKDSKHRYCHSKYNYICRCNKAFDKNMLVQGTIYIKKSIYWIQAYYKIIDHHLIFKSNINKNCKYDYKIFPIRGLIMHYSFYDMDNMDNMDNNMNNNNIKNITISTAIPRKKLTMKFTSFKEKSEWCRNIIMYQNYLNCLMQFPGIVTKSTNITWY